MLPSQSNALADHQHPRATVDSVGLAALADEVYGGVPSTINPDDAGAAGTAATVSRSDHEHEFNCGAPVSLTKTATNAEGNATVAARRNHEHATDGLPWGVVAQQILTTANGPHAASTLTDFALNNVPVISGHVYAVHVHTYGQLGAAGTWHLILRVNGVDFDRMTSVDTTAVSKPSDATTYWTAPATQATDDFTIFASEVGASGDLTLTGAAAVRRTFTITDLGPP